MLKKKKLIILLVFIIISTFMIAGMIFPLKEEEELEQLIEPKEELWNGIKYNSLSLITKDNKNYLKLNTTNDLPKSLEKQQVVLTIKQKNNKVFFEKIITIPSYEPNEEKEIEIECSKKSLPENYNLHIEIYSPIESG